MSDTCWWADAPDTDGPLVLAIESSCDETAAAVLAGKRDLRSSVVHSQVPVHAQYGGVVPELASRSHIVAIHDVVRRALDEADTTLKQIDGIAVTRGPGLVGSLLVGTEYAKGIALARNLPVEGVNHLEGHLMAPFLAESESGGRLDWPYVGLVVSGGHTSLYIGHAPGRWEELGRTLDDAAGEAFDKVSKELGLGYPGGAVIDKLAEDGNPAAIDMPRPMMNKPNYDFSFSGLKTFVGYWLRDNGVPTGPALHDLAASFRQAVVDVLVSKTLRAAQRRGIERVVVSGGVACNRGLRDRIHERAARRNIRVFIPPPHLCTDNAAMIGSAGYGRVHRRIQAGDGFSDGTLNAVSTWHLEDLPESEGALR